MSSFLSFKRLKELVSNKGLKNPSSMAKITSAKKYKSRIDSIKPPKPLKVK